MLGTLDFRKVDTIEQHSQLRRIEGNAVLAGVGSWELETAAFEAFVPKDEAAVIEVEDLSSIESLAKKNEEMTGVRIQRPLFFEDRQQAVVALRTGRTAPGA